MSTNLLEKSKQDKKTKEKKTLTKSIVLLVLAVVLIMGIFIFGCVFMNYKNKSDVVEASVNASEKVAEMKEKNEKEISKLEKKMAKKDEEISELEKEVNELLDQAVLLSKVSKTITVEELSFEINKIGELATVEYLYTNAGVFENHRHIKDLQVPFTESSFVAKWSGIIKAGIDLEKIKTEIDEDNKIITILLPKSEILSNEFDNKSFEVVDESNNILNQIKVEEVNEFIAENKDNIIKEVIDKGFLEKADINAKAIIENSLLSNTVINENYTLNVVMSDVSEETALNTSTTNTTAITTTTTTTTVTTKSAKTTAD